MSNSLIFPPHLQEGDRVIILSPSGKIDKSFLKGACKRLESWGLEAVLAKHADGSHGTYAGSIRQRLEDLQEAMDDEKAKVILPGNRTSPDSSNTPNGSSDSATSRCFTIFFSRTVLLPCTLPWHDTSP